MGAPKKASAGNRKRIPQMLIRWKQAFYNRHVFMNRRTFLAGGIILKEAARRNMDSQIHMGSLTCGNRLSGQFSERHFYTI